MKIRLAYGKKGMEVRLPDNLDPAVVEPEYVPALAEQTESIRDALRQPIGSRVLRDVVRSSDKVSVVLNDITRPTPYPVILPALLAELDHVRDDHILLLNATGTHRPNTQPELRTMLGDQIVDRFRIVQNDALDRSTHVRVGTTRAGNEVWLHKEYVECDVRILTGFIEPHFFAGFSGGGKACMPGLALLETVLRNHNVTHIDDPKATWGVTYGNPLWEEILEAASMVPPVFLLNVTLNRDKQITGVFAGDLEQAHKEGCAFAKKTAMVPVKQPYDIVITSNSGYPLDLNVYQSIKGISAASQIVKKGGSIIMAADCWDGIPDHGQYARLLRHASSPEHLLETIRAPGFSVQDMWQVQIQALISQKADVYFYSENLRDEQIIAALLKPCHNIGATVQELVQKLGRAASVCVLPEGPQTIPYICRSSV
jgi:nickel-dependent lactate racemase